MSRNHFFFRFFLIGATASFGTRTSSRASASNCVNPFGRFFLASMLSLQSHKSTAANLTQTPDFLLSFFGVHIASLSPDESFVALDLAGEFAEFPGAHRLTDSMQHKPCGLLGDAERPPEFVTADPILAVGDGPDRDKPLIHPERRILEDGADFVRKLFPAILAAEHGAGGYFADSNAAAMMAAEFSVGPFNLAHVGIADFKVGEVADGGDEALWNFHLLPLRYFQIQDAEHVLEFVRPHRTSPRHIVFHVIFAHHFSRELRHGVCGKPELCSSGDDGFLDLIGRHDSLIRWGLFPCSAQSEFLCDLAPHHHFFSKQMFDIFSFAIPFANHPRIGTIWPIDLAFPPVSFGILRFGVNGITDRLIGLIAGILIGPENGGAIHDFPVFIDFALASENSVAIDRDFLKIHGISFRPATGGIGVMSRITGHKGTDHFGILSTTGHAVIAKSP